MGTLYYVRADKYDMVIEDDGKIRRVLKKDIDTSMFGKTIKKYLLSINDMSKWEIHSETTEELIGNYNVLKVFNKSKSRFHFMLSAFNVSKPSMWYWLNIEEFHNFVAMKKDNGETITETEVFNITRSIYIREQEKALSGIETEFNFRSARLVVQQLARRLGVSDWGRKDIPKEIWDENGEKFKPLSP